MTPWKTTKNSIFIHQENEQYFEHCQDSYSKTSYAFFKSSKILLVRNYGIVIDKFAIL